MTDSCGCGCGPVDNTGKKIEDIEAFKTRVTEVIEQIRPSLQMDGGDIKLIDINDSGVVQVALQGACATCPHAAMTMKMGVERVLKEEIPEIVSVDAVDL